MKKIVLFLLLAVSIASTAQENYYISKPLMLNNVPLSGTQADSVLVYSAGKIVKLVPRSAFGSGGGGTLQTVLNAGKIAEFDEGNTYINFGNGTENDRAAEITVGDGTNRASLGFNNSQVAITHTSAGFVGKLGADDGKLLIEQYNGVGSTGKATLHLPLDVDGDVKYEVPSKPSRYEVDGVTPIPYVLATLDDLTAGVTLQQVMDNGSTATFNTGDQTVNFFSGGSTSVRIDSNEETGGSSLQVGNGQVELANAGDTTQGRFSVIGGVPKIEYQDGIGITAVDFSTPVASTTIKFPAKPEGTYTLATLDDISGGGSQDLQSVINLGGYAENSSNDSSFISILEEGVNAFRIGMSDAPVATRTAETTFDIEPQSITFNNIDVATSNTGNIQISNGKVSLSDIVMGGSFSTKVEFETPTGSETTLKFPAKPEGTYTLATLDDISGGGGTLQSVLDAGKTASFDSGHSTISILDGDADEREFLVTVGNGTTESGVSASVGYAGINSFNATDSGVLGSEEGKVGIIQQKIGLGQTNLEFADPTATGTVHIKIPAKPWIAGNYTLATTSDIPTTKVLKALITQSGTSDPVLTILKNTTGMTFTTHRNGVGGYTIVAGVSLEIAKTFLTIMPYGGVDGNYVTNASITNSGGGFGSSIQVYTTLNNVMYDGLLSYTPFSIEMY